MEDAHKPGAEHGLGGVYTYAEIFTMKVINNWLHTWGLVMITRVGDHEQCGNGIASFLRFEKLHNV